MPEARRLAVLGVVALVSSLPGVYRALYHPRSSVMIESQQVPFASIVAAAVGGLFLLCAIGLHFRQKWAYLLAIGIGAVCILAVPPISFLALWSGLPGLWRASATAGAEARFLLALAALGSFAVVLSIWFFFLTLYRSARRGITAGDACPAQKTHPPDSGARSGAGGEDDGG